MKTFDRILNVLLALALLGLIPLLFSAVPALAQTATADSLALPEPMLNTPIREWQLNGVTLLLIIQVLGRAFAGLKSGGGLVGIYRGIVFGTNTPPPTPPTA